jgi:hypothetical protein
MATKRSKESQSIGVSSIIEEVGLSGDGLTRKEAIALRVLIACVSRGNLNIDIAKDSVRLANAFAEEVGWE